MPFLVLASGVLVVRGQAFLFHSQTEPRRSGGPLRPPQALKAWWDSDAQCRQGRVGWRPFQTLLFSISSSSEFSVLLVHPRTFWMS